MASDNESVERKKLVYPKILENMEAFPACIYFKFFERRSTSESEDFDEVFLYMPEEFGQPSTISWDSSFSATGAVLNVANQFSDSLIPGDPKKAGRLGKLAGKVVGGLKNLSEPAQDLISVATGLTINPYLAQLFRGVNFRNFSYTFRFVPFSEDDCNTIKEIIDVFRKWSLPSGPGGAGDPLLHYPGEVEIRYLWLDKNNEWIHRFKRSVITEVDIGYTGAGMWSMMRNGFPTETVLKITLSELQIVVREDVEKRGF